MSHQDPFQLKGHVLENRYRVDDPIGEGGFGVVYRGFHVNLQHPIAIKCLKIPSHFTPQARDMFLQRFREEGRILIKLGDAPGVPRVYDCGVINLHSGQVPYLVMEWLDGNPLEAMLANRRMHGHRGVPAGDAINLLLPAIDALAVAHESQIAHRDIKPANLFIVRGVRGPTMKVLDFGIAKAMQEGDSMAQAANATSTNFRAFTPNYASPEQFAPKRYGASGPWTDVHALGLVLVELLTDQPAYPSDDFVECLEAATSDQRPSARGRGAPVSDALEHVIQRALARSPEHRFPNAASLAAALRSVPEASAGFTSGPTFGPIEAMPRTERAPAISALVGHRLPADSGQHPAHHPSGGYPSAPGGYPQSGNRPSHPLAGSHPGLGSGGMHSTAPGSFPPPGYQQASAMTAQPVAFTHDRSLVPPVPTAPTTKSRGKKGSAIPYVLGGVMLLGAGAAGVYFITQPDKKKSKKSNASSSALVETSAEKKPVTKTIIALDFAIQKDLHPVAEITEADAKGKHHYRLIDEDGKVIRVERLNPAGTLTETTSIEHAADGTITRKIVDARGQLVDTYWISKDGIETHEDRWGSKLINGCARVALKFDDKGNVTDRLCQDAEGHVIIDSRGCQVNHLEYGEHRLAVATRCQQDDGRPLTDSSGVHLRRYTYDSKMRMTEQSFYGSSDETVQTSGGCNRERYTYDDANNRLTETCIGATGFQTTYAGTAISSFTYVFDGNGCMLKQSYLDLDGKPVSYGTLSGRVYTRDAYCSELSWSTVGPAGALTALQHAAARVERVFDDKGDEKETRCYDEAQKEFNCAGDSSLKDQGTLIRITRDDRGRMLSKKAFNHAGKPTRETTGYPHETRRQYNDKGYVEQVQYFDPDGKPTLALGTVAKRTFKYDALGAEIANASFGVSGEPVIDATGAHEVRRTYDAKHRLVTIELRDKVGGYPTETSIRFGAVVWPPNAVRLSIYREGTKMWNKFYDAAGKELKVVDCSLVSSACEG